MKINPNFFVLILAIAATAGCTTVNEYVRDFNFVSVSDETKIGTEMSAEIAKQMKILPASAPEAGRVRDIGKKLVAALPQREFTYTFDVVEDKTPNAFTIPGGHIYVHTGILSFADNDDEIAGVIAHEIAHAYERHPAKGLSRQYGVDYLSRLLFKQNQNQVKELALKIAKQGILTKYSRSDENQADEVAFLLLKKTGYSQDGLLLFFKKLARLKTGYSIPLLSTHPPTPERIARIETLKANQGKLITNADEKKLL